MAKVGKKTGKQTQAGRNVYETPEGEMVSEKSTTFEYKGKWINIPTIHGGKQYSEDQLVEMLDEGLIEPTSVHDELEDAINAAKERSESLEFNKGGTPMMDEQMELFEEGGLKEEGGMVDEESGNDVPTGSTKEEVRDDIPAMLSEGEFVFPADVVRYHGLEKLMELRQEAKMGIKKMEAMGQMGNADEATLPDDIPFTVDDLIIVAEPMEAEDNKEPKEKAHGGVLHAAQGTYVQPTINSGIVGYQPSIYSQPPVYQPPSFNPPVYQPPSSIVPVQPPMTAGYSPLYQPTPTPQVAPKFEADAKEFAQVDPDAYKDITKDTTEPEEEVTEPTVETTQVTRQATDDDSGIVSKTKMQSLVRDTNTAASKARKDFLNKESYTSSEYEQLKNMWVDTKQGQMASAGLGVMSGGIGLLGGLAARNEQKKVEKALLKANKNYKEEDWYKDYSVKDTLGAFKEDVTEGLKQTFTKEGRKEFYQDYQGTYNPSDLFSSGATSQKYTVADSNDLKEGTSMPKATGHLTVREQQSFDNAVNSGDSSVAQHYAIIANRNAKLDAYAKGEPVSGLSKYDIAEANKFGGSLTTAINEGRAVANKNPFKPARKVTESEPAGSNDSDKTDASCVIATHGVANGGFSLMEKAKAELWCERTYHGKWYGEAFRRGYRYAGRKAIEQGKAAEHYQEFKDFVSYGRGLKKDWKSAVNYYKRTIQFFLTGLFVREDV